MSSARRLLAGSGSLALALALLPGCGWHTGLVPPGGAHSVGVEYFDNDTPERDIEAELSGELGRSLLQLVDAPVVPPEEADVVLQGRIEVYRRRGGVRNEDNVLLEAGVRIAVRAELVDRRSGTALGSTRAAVWSNYAVDVATNEREARRRALRYIADQLVLDLFTPPSYEGTPEASPPEPSPAP